MALILKSTKVKSNLGKLVSPAPAYRVIVIDAETEFVDRRSAENIVVRRFEKLSAQFAVRYLCRTDTVGHIRIGIVDVITNTKIGFCRFAASQF